MHWLHSERLWLMCAIKSGSMCVNIRCLPQMILFSQVHFTLIFTATNHYCMRTQSLIIYYYMQCEQCCVFLVLVPVQADLMRKESTQSVPSLVERSFPAYSFPRLIVMEFRWYFHCSTGVEIERTTVHGENRRESTEIKYKQSRERCGNCNCGHNDTNARYWQIISQMSFLLSAFKNCMTKK